MGRNLLRRIIGVFFCDSISNVNSRGLNRVQVDIEFSSIMHFETFLRKIMLKTQLMCEVMYGFIYGLMAETKLTCLYKNYKSMSAQVD